MSILNKIFKKKKEPLTGAFFGSSEDEMENLICGIGETEILETEIRISNYPFEPSAVYPEKTIKANDINEISWDSYPPLLRLENEVIFISRGFSENLKQFVDRNNISSFEATRNWNWLLEPYVDTEYTEETDNRLIELLNKNGITKSEIEQLRNEVKEQMLKYNFDTMLWDWVSLGLSDVLGAMKVKYNKEQFSDFYKRAMEIQLRT